MSRLTALEKSFAKAGAQIFFQAGEGAGKGVVVLPVREIGDVIFSDFFRQIFAGVRVQALPFFQRRVIRQRDGKKFAPLFRALDCGITVQ